MKALTCLLLSALGVFSLPAQTFVDDLATKRAYLVYSLRSLGPLAPYDWVATGAVWSQNDEIVLTDSPYHPVGNFGYAGFTSIEYTYTYRDPGDWTDADPPVNTTTALTTFGFHATWYLATWMQFWTDAATYNIAGLRYQSYILATGRNASGQLLGYELAAGTPVYQTTLVFSSTRTFDLLQNVETPSFKVADYYFGRYLNYPPDTHLPTPQDTQAQSAGALLVSAVGAGNQLMGWVKEGVYRPGLTLQPGYSAPRLYTYMQQYFDSAWLTDPASGEPPRLSALNWNNAGKVNTNTAVRTGQINPQGGFIPTTHGKQIITTRALENGHYGELKFYALAMRVDKNRDGLLTTNDVTTAANPHTFWVNNDRDRAVYEEKNLWDELDVNDGTPTDSEFTRSNGRIPTLRDLEDYDRLHIPGLRELCRDLPTGQGYTVTLRWKTVQAGTPQLVVFKAVDSQGGQNYLTNQAAATAQIAPTVYPPAGAVTGVSPLYMGRVEASITPVLHNDSYRGDTDYFIYCATSRGAGELAVGVYKNSLLLGEASVFLDLRDVKELYERWTLGDGSGVDPSTNAVAVAEGLPVGVAATQFNDSAGTGRSYILFVHGWNMAPWEKDAFAEAAFKRLYWQGYTNRFGALRWPTGYGFSDELFSSPGPVTYPAHYDRSEQVAWKSGEGLRHRLVNMNQRYPGKTHLLAHSMGNVVAGEALALQAEKYGGGIVVNTYVASQAAVPLECYSRTNVAPVYQMPFVYEHPLQEQYAPYLILLSGVGWTLQQLNGPVNWDTGTPDVYLGSLEANRVSATRRVNFYNPNDYALSMPAWGFNQLLKPDTSGSTVYSYYRFGGAQNVPKLGGGATASPPYFLLPSPARSGTPQFTGLRQKPGYFVAGTTSGRRYLDFELRLSDMYEAMAFATEARGYPLGRIGDAIALGQQVDIRTLWLGDPDPDSGLGSYGRHKWHSGQFRSNNLRQGNYWSVLLSDRAFNLR